MVLGSILVIFSFFTIIFSLTGRYHVAVWFPLEQCFPVSPSITNNNNSKNGDNKVSQIVGYHDSKIMLRTCDNGDCKAEDCDTYYETELEFKTFQPNIFSDIIGLRDWSLRYLELLEDPPNVQSTQFVIVGFEDYESCHHNFWYGTQFFIYSDPKASLIVNKCLSAGNKKSFSCQCSTDKELTCKYYTDSNDCSGKQVEDYSYNCNNTNFRMYCGEYSKLHNPNTGIYVDLSLDSYFDVSSNPVIYNNNCHASEVKNHYSTKDEKDIKLFNKYYYPTVNNTCQPQEVKNCESEIYQPFEFMKNIPTQYNFLYTLLGGSFFAIKNEKLKFDTLGPSQKKIKKLRDGQENSENVIGFDLEVKGISGDDLVYIYDEASFSFCHQQTRRECLYKNGTVIQKYYDNFRCKGTPVEIKVSKHERCGDLPRINNDDLDDGSNTLILVIIIVSSLLCCCFCFCEILICFGCFLVCNICVFGVFGFGGKFYKYVEMKYSGYRRIN